MAHEGGLGQVAGEDVSGEAANEDLFGGVGHKSERLEPVWGIVAR